MAQMAATSFGFIGAHARNCAIASFASGWCDKLWPVDQTMSESPKGLFHNQWLFRLVLAGRKMDPEDVKLATQLVETLLSLRQREDEVIE